jgi:ABC-type transport system involved in multi-copper enzyme maturation permease subunit
MTRSLVVARKAMRDFASLKLLLAYFVPFGAVTYLFANGMTSAAAPDLATLPLRVQEQVLTASFVQIAFIWSTTFPVMVLVAVLVGNSIAKEAQRGTLRILLSKPVRRRQVLLGKVGAIVLFAFVLTVTNLLVTGAAVFYHADAAPEALGASVFPLLPGALLFGLVVCLALTAFGALIATVTGNRLHTLLATLLIPALFFGFLVGRAMTAGTGVYEDYALYLVDVSYHFGNLYVAALQANGVEFSPFTQAKLGTVTGVFDVSEWGPDPLVGDLSGTVPLVEHVPMALSVGVIGGLCVVLLWSSVAYFERKDIA